YATTIATKPTADDDEARRKRKASANRILTMLKAALNRAFNRGRVPNDTAWRKVKPFRNVDAPVIRYLTVEESRRLVNACPPEFRRLVQAALLTGCRYSELCRVKPGDFNPDAGTLTVRISKSGKPRHVVLTDEGAAMFAGWVAGLPPTELIFRRSNGRAWGPSDQQRPIALASSHASINPPATFHVLRHTHGSMLAMRGTPLGVIAAQLGHADTRITERHYAHLAPSYVADTIRASFPALGMSLDTN